MKIKALLFALFLLLCLSPFAQKKIESANIPIIHVFMGYVIRLSTNAEGRYNYEIIQQGKPVVNQTRNPFNPSLSGLATTEDALKVAQWQVQQLIAGVPSSVATGQPLPEVVARQLNVTIK